MLQEAKITERNSNGENGDPEHLSDEDREAMAKPETMIVSIIFGAKIQSLKKQKTILERKFESFSLDSARKLKVISKISS